MTKDEDEDETICPNWILNKCSICGEPFVYYDGDAHSVPAAELARVIPVVQRRFGENVELKLGGGASFHVVIYEKGVRGPDHHQGGIA